MVPVILKLVIETWEQMPQIMPDAKEDKVTESLCKALKQNRTARDLPFQIHIQMVELEPANDEKLGRMDIAFLPLINREDVYFCLECKRLNVANGSGVRTYASEYVRFGMLRFIRGQYSKTVKHGAMSAYVLDGNTSSAIQNVESNIQINHQELGMSPPGSFQPSTVLTGDARARETHHKRVHDNSAFCIHHLFMPRKDAA
ncbi:MAG: hypothetical protein SFV18_17515 [Bryobacteraceae bacterium]|nr:hypothetical protein [Bryobacteraceae bacterium]